MINKLFITIGVYKEIFEFYCEYHKIYLVEYEQFIRRIHWKIVR